MKTRLQQAFFNSSQGPNKRISKRNSTGNASWGVGPNTENFEKNFYRQCKLAGPNTEAYEKSAYDNVRVGWDNDKEILFL
ncbi:hypothetical protein SA2288_00650 [Staphylococcus aureus]|nr:hypothetical protein SA2288_00650 [Staphylococcus aureus]